MTKERKYLGEFLVDIATHPEFSKYTRSDWAMTFIERYGQIEGDHHKTWVLDQVARCLKGMPITVKEARWDDGLKEYRISTAGGTEEDYGRPETFEYFQWVDDMKGKYNEVTNEYEYGYDFGISP